MSRDITLKAVHEKLEQVIDPETGMSVMRMRLVEELEVDDNGVVSSVFRPSSPLCPIAVPLALSIMQAINEVPGVTGQRLRVEGYSQSDQLNEILQSLLEP